MIELLRTWWAQDAIRASPHEGQLLALKPPDLLRFDEEWFEVVDRDVRTQPGSDRPVVKITCRAAKDDQLCWLEMAGDTVYVRQRTKVRVVEPSEIEVFSRGSHRWDDIWGPE